MRVVLDTSVLVAGLRSQRGASSRVLFAIAERRCVPLVTTALFLEYGSVLLRAEQRLATGMNAADVEGFLAAFASAAEPIELNFLWRETAEINDVFRLIRIRPGDPVKSGAYVTFYNDLLRLYCAFADCCAHSEDSMNTQSFNATRPGSTVEP
jgi:predicted nucleic acid-binding protein